MAFRRVSLVLGTLFLWFLLSPSDNGVSGKDVGSLFTITLLLLVYGLFGEDAAKTYLRDGESYFKSLPPSGANAPQKNRGVILLMVLTAPFVLAVCAFVVYRLSLWISPGDSSPDWAMPVLLVLTPVVFFGWYRFLNPRSEKTLDSARKSTMDQDRQLR